MNQITFHRPEGLVRSPAFSHVAVIPPTAALIHVGGQNAVDAAGALVGDADIAAQTAQVMTNLDIALRSAGGTMADLVSLSVLIVEGSDLGAAYAVAASRLDPDREPPLVNVGIVAALAVPGALVELSAVAAVLP